MKAVKWRENGREGKREKGRWRGGRREARGGHDSVFKLRFCSASETEITIRFFIP